MSTSVVRAARILDRLAHSRKPMTLAEIAGELDIPKRNNNSKNEKK